MYGFNNILSIRTLRENIILRKPFQLLLVCIPLLIVYYPVLFGGLCKIDDEIMVKNYLDIHDWSFLGLFLHPLGTGIYYRPIMFISYMIDNSLFHLDVGFLHLENVLLHIINVLLIFWLTYQLLPRERKRRSYLPLASALLFGLHPINTESVSWISGRTDLLACIFVLLSANSLLLFKRYYSYPFLFASGIFMLLGFLAKEITLAFLPGALLLVLAHHDKEECTPASPSNTPGSVLRSNVVLATIGLSALFLFYLLRSHAFSINTDDRLLFSAKIILSDIPDTTMVVLNALAFYMKKLFVPFPLNFAIIEIEPLYEFLGLPIVMFFLYVLLRRTVISALFMSGIFLIFPAFIVAFYNVSWTPYAERYLYISSAFIMVATVLTISRLLEENRKLQFWTASITVLIVIIMAVGVYHRSKIWSSNVALFQDIVSKSPQLLTTRATYGLLLADERGDIEQARKELMKVKTESEARVMYKKSNDKGSMWSPSEIDPSFFHNRLGYWEDPDLGLAYLMEKEGKKVEAVAAYEAILEKTHGGSARARRHVIMLYTDSLMRTTNVSKRALILQKLSQHVAKWKDHDRAEFLYQIGKILSIQGEREDAIFYLRMAHNAFNEGSEYKTITAKLISNLESEEK